MTRKVSVIIPCYNAEKTVTHALDSLKYQVYKDFNVILINDGSADGTAAVIEQYIKQNCDMNITLKSCENGGVSRARNIGLDICNTKYVAFLDADDMYHPMFLQRLVSEVEARQADLAISVYRRNQFKSEHKVTAGRTVASVDLLEMYFHKRAYRLNFWGAIYKKELLTSHVIRFSQGVKYGEDSEFFCKYLYHCKNVVFINEELYCYIDRSDSAQHKVSYDRVQNIEVFKRILAYWGDKAPVGSEYIVARAIWSCLKDFAIGYDRYYKKLQDAYDVKNAMRLLAKVEEEQSVRYSAVAYLVHPIVFKVLINMFARSGFCGIVA